MRNGIVMIRILAFFLVFMAGCAYHTQHTIDASGKNLRYGIIAVEEGEISIKAYRKIN